MKIQETALPGVLLLTPKIYHDTRGAFQETWNQRAMTEAGLQPIGCRIISPFQKRMCFGASITR